MLRTSSRLQVLLLPLLLVASVVADDATTIAELEKPTRILVKDKPLKLLAIILEENHGVPFGVEPGQHADLAITCDFAGVSLRTALTKMLTPHKLGFEVRNGTIWIAPKADKK
jgi:hypothetical protein